MCQVWPRSVAQQQRPVAITRILFFVSMILSPTFTANNSKSGWNLTFCFIFFFRELTHVPHTPSDLWVRCICSVNRRIADKAGASWIVKLNILDFSHFHFNRLISTEETEESKKVFFFFRPVRSHTIAAVNDHHFPRSHTEWARSPQRVYGPAEEAKSEEEKTAS